MKEMEKDTRVYSVAQIASTLMVCEKTVRDLIREGKIKKVSAMGAIRVTHSEYMRFINGGKSE
tara:strand:+ start:349 stop:537 length:189 start_codon:yes stop_codon:yes gene_type:complete